MCGSPTDLPLRGFTKLRQRNSERTLRGPWTRERRRLKLPLTLRRLAADRSGLPQRARSGSDLRHAFSASICRQLAICLQFSEAIFTGHSGHRQGPTFVQTRSGDWEPLPGMNSALCPLPRPLAPPLPADHKFGVNFCTDSVASPEL